MRLVCPNCEAKYEVPEDAIPDIGRDVQCANCGHSWFQMRPRPASAVADPAPVAEVAPAPAEVVSPAVEEPAPEAPAADLAVAEAVVVADEVVAAEAIVVEDDGAAAKAEDAVDASPAEDAVDPVPEDVAETVALAADDAKPVDEPAPVEDVGSIDPVDSAATPDAKADDLSAAQPAQPQLEPEAALAYEAVAVTDAADAEPEVEPDLAKDATDTDEADIDPAPSAAAAAAYAVDESVLAILREEAEREAQARRAEARPLESQTDLGLDAAMPGRSKPVLVATNSVTADHDGDAALKPSARRDLLPDVEEINSTLRPSEVPSEDFVQPAPLPGEARAFAAVF
ncbi:MAG: hypothetical protein HC783_12105 [Rhodobacteraceae bacterium]|nr:hypothetical protein [Paracoccaceae bacterium]